MSRKENKGNKGNKGESFYEKVNECNSNYKPHMVCG